MDKQAIGMQRDCPRCDSTMPRPYPNDPHACPTCGWGDYVNAEKRGEREFDNR
jgi:hypothetical protein